MRLQSPRRRSIRAYKFGKHQWEAYVCIYIAYTSIFFSLFSTAMRHLTLHQFLIEHVHETECKVRNVVNVTLGLSPGIPGDNFSSGIFDPKSL